MPSGDFFLIAGFLLLAIAFFPISFELANGLSETYHLITMLQTRPSETLGSWLEGVALWGILPIAASLGLLATAYLKRGFSGMSSLKLIPILIIGGLTITWGYLFCRASYVSYFEAISSTHDEQIVGIDGYLLRIYSLFGIYGALWLVLGVFLICASAYCLLKRAKLKVAQNNGKPYVSK